jgi:hypothetical protein
MYTAVMAEAVVRMLLRLPADLHAELVVRAEREQRSLHGQIVYLLRRAISGDA